MSHFLRTVPPPDVKGGYSSFRPYVRADFQHRCAYCLFWELLAAGEENFELDHFRPKSLFPDDAQNFYNIYYACHPCNHLKRDLWPSKDMERRGLRLVDLCKDEFEAHFQLCSDGHLQGLTDAGRYTIDALRLNRKHLVRLREMLSQFGVDMHKKGISQEQCERLLRELLG
ncbi:MAG: hypothetical protein LAO20_01465 [Acidobacteriia bacterium]|nr:hypothetical protein [Terriglobia bacterium]